MSYKKLKSKHCFQCCSFINNFNGKILIYHNQFIYDFSDIQFIRNVEADYTMLFCKACIEKNFNLNLNYDTDIHETKYKIINNVNDVQRNIKRYYIGDRFHDLILNQ